MAKEFLQKKQVIAWSSSVIPEGWQICDGTNGTPNLIGYFIMGASINDDLGDVGGASSHSHGASTSGTASGGSHGHSGTVSWSPWGAGGAVSCSTWLPSRSATYESHSHSVSLGGVGGSTNVSHTHTSTPASANSLPPYIYLVYIMKVG